MHQYDTAATGTGSLMRVLVLLFSLAAGSAAHAGIIQASDTGWYDDTGLHQPEVSNFAVGKSPFSTLHNFFVFDLSGYGTITSAVLRAYLVENTSTEPPPLNLLGGGYLSIDPFETWGLYEVSTSLQSLVDGSAGVSAFNDLGSGPGYGSVDVTADDQGSFVEVTLNASALVSLSSANGLWAIGGALTTINADLNAIFGHSHTDPRVHLELEGNYLPVPGTLLLLLLGIGGLCTAKLKRSRTARTAL